MKELIKALDICFTGCESTRALARFHAQLRRWNLAMPKVPPLVLDFGLGEFAQTGLIEYWVANEEKAGYCGKFLFVFAGQTCPLHRHRTKHETFFIVKGRVRMRFGATTRVLKAGDVLPVPPWKYHSFTGMGPALLLEVSMPCQVDDNYFHNRRIPIGGNHRPETRP